MMRMSLYLQGIIDCLYRRKRLRLRVPYPRVITFETSNICNLQCPFCPTGRNIRRIPSKILNFEEFKFLADKLPKSISTCYLFSWGEEFLNPDIFRIIGYLKEKNVKVVISTNFSFDKPKEFFENIVDSCLDEIVISLDGASQESYSKYRVKGSFIKVIENINKLKMLQREKGKRRPRIIWKFIINRHNENEIGQAQKMSKKMGVEFTLAKMNLGDTWPDMQPYIKEPMIDRINYWLPQNIKFRNSYYTRSYRLPLNDFACEALFNTCVICCDGKLYPCCFCADEKSSFGDLHKQTFEEIWNGVIYQSARSLFMKKKYANRKVETVCDMCMSYRKQSK
ncbi:radical SAM/SPASM domain-containing protein [Candidatus Omnitrophota bacterium]